MNLLKPISRKDAKAQRGVFAPLREIFQDCCLLALTVCDTELNRIVAVQECDATMLEREQMPGA